MERHGILNTKIPKLHLYVEALRDIKHQNILYQNHSKSHCSTWHGNASVILDSISTQSQGQWRTKNLHLQRLAAHFKTPTKFFRLWGHAVAMLPQSTRSFQSCNSTSGMKGARLASGTSSVARFERNIARLLETVGIPLVTVLVLYTFVFSLIKESGVRPNLSSEADSISLFPFSSKINDDSMINAHPLTVNLRPVQTPSLEACLKCGNNKTQYQEQWCFGCWTLPIKSHLKVTLQPHIPPLPSAAAHSPKAPLCEKEETPLPVDTTSDSLCALSPIISTSKSQPLGVAYNKHKSHTSTSLSQSNTCDFYYDFEFWTILCLGLE